MTEVAVTAEQIARAVEDIAARRPAYRQLIAYYGKVFAAQEAVRQRISVAPPEISKSEATSRRAGGFGLLSLSEFPVDAACSVLLEELCVILADSRPEHAAAATALAEAIASGNRDPEPLFAAMLAEADSVVAEAAAETGLAADLLGALLYLSLQPSLCHTAAQAAELLPAGTPAHSDQCPVCGSDAALSVLDDAGNRSLFCGFCWHRWPVRRMACPHCGDAQEGSHEYFFDPNEKEYRVDVCKTCRWYIKTIDARQLGRPLYPPLEQVATLHLDMLAQEKGYAKGV